MMVVSRRRHRPRRWFRGSGPGGRVEVTSTGTIMTHGEESRGIFAQSVGGFAGSSGGAGGLFAFGADGESAGSGGEVTITNSGAS